MKLDELHQIAEFAAGSPLVKMNLEPGPVDHIRLTFGSGAAVAIPARSIVNERELIKALTWALAWRSAASILPDRNRYDEALELVAILEAETQSTGVYRRCKALLGAPTC